MNRDAIALLFDEFIDGQPEDQLKVTNNVVLESLKVDNFPKVKGLTYEYYNISESTRTKIWLEKYFKFCNSCITKLFRHDFIHRQILFQSQTVAFLINKPFFEIMTEWSQTVRHKFYGAFQGITDYGACCLIVPYLVSLMPVSMNHFLIATP